MTKKIWGGLIAAILFASIAVGGCLQDAGLLRSSTNCTGHPSIPKYFDPQVFAWGERDILAVSDGNEILFWDVTNQERPIFIAQSNFNVANQGDSDYDLMNFSVCEGCRYGTAAFKLGIVIWDLGTGLNPTFGARHFFPSTDPRGGFMYKQDGKEFIIASGLPEGTGKVGTVYRVIGVDELLKIQDINSSLYRVTNGIRVQNYIYLGTLDNWVYIYAIRPLGVQYVKRSPIRASLGRGKGLSINGDLLVSAFIDGGKVWGVLNPENPALRSTIPGRYQYSASSGEFMLIVGENNIPKTFRLDNPSSPIPVDPGFWDPSNPWNDYGTSCEFPTGAAFTVSGQRLFLSRYAVLQMVNFTACGSGQPPTPTPTPPPWPTPYPTCVPNCTRWFF